jgi:hypothetical protein
VREKEGVSEQEQEQEQEQERDSARKDRREVGRVGSGRQEEVSQAVICKSQAKPVIAQCRCQSPSGRPCGKTEKDQSRRILRFLV